MESNFEIKKLRDDLAYLYNKVLKPKMEEEFQKWFKDNRKLKGWYWLPFPHRQKEDETENEFRERAWAVRPWDYRRIVDHRAELFTLYYLIRKFEKAGATTVTLSSEEVSRISIIRDIYESEA